MPTYLHMTDIRDTDVLISDDDDDEQFLNGSLNGMSLDSSHNTGSMSSNGSVSSSNRSGNSSSSSADEGKGSNVYCTTLVEGEGEDRDSPSTLSSDGISRSPKPEHLGMHSQSNSGQMRHVHSHSRSNSIRNATGAVDNWGWFDDESTEGSRVNRKQRLLDFSTMEILPLNDMNKEKANGGVVTAPKYVLEESLSSQKLWKHTAGNRPPQPVEERAMFEKMWAENFDKSQVEYNIPQEVLKATTPIAISPFNDTDYGEDHDIESFSLTAFHALSNRLSSKQHDQIHLVKAAEVDAMEANIHNWTKGNQQRTDEMQISRSALSKKEAEKFTVFMKGDNVFGTTVSKSFPCPGRSHMETMSVSIDKYRVIQLKNGFRYAQYLVVCCIGDFRNTVGVWKRFSDFERLSRMVATEQDGYCLTAEDHDREVLPNAVTSWRLLKKRQRWFRCLDAGYLSLKVFLLERFLHDILFESSSPEILTEFIASSDEGYEGVGGN